MSDYFIKLAEKQDEKRELLKDLGITVGGTALGAATGYGTAALLKKRYQSVLDKLDPNTRVKYLGPTAAALGGALSLTHVLRQNAKRRNKNEQRNKTSRD